MDVGIKTRAGALADPLVGLAVTDAGGCLVHVSQPVWEMLGRRPLELNGKPYASIVHPSDHERERLRLTELVGSSEAYFLEQRFLHADGGIRFGGVTGRFAAGPPGTVVRRIVDLTPSNEASAHRDRMLSRAPGLAAVFTLDGKLLRGNDACGRLLGWSLDELRRCPNWLELIHPDDRADLVAAMGDLGSGVTVRDHEARLRGRDADYRWLSITVTAALDEGVLYAFGHDVTEAREAAEALRASERRFRQLFEQSPLGIVLTDAGARFVHVNPAFCDMLGYPAVELVSRSFAEVTHPDDVARQIDLGRRVRSGELSHAEIEKRYIRRDGETVWGRLHLRTLDEPEFGPACLLTMVEDISEIKAAEAARRELDGLRDAFIRIVSHDLQNPLVAIAGLSDILAGSGPSLGEAEARRIAGRIGSQARRLQQMVERLLSLDRLYHEEETVRTESVDVAGLVAAAVDAVDFAGRTCRCDLPDVTVALDPVHFERILENLLANAVAHTPGGTTIDVRVRVDGDNLVLAVDDDGPGVPEHLREAVFGLFHSSRTGRARGGVGLWVVASLAALGGGRAWVEERPGGGASFRVALPLGGCS